MKYIFTFGNEKRADTRSYIEVSDIVTYKIEIKKTLDGRSRDIPVEVVCYTKDYCKYILTPTVPITTKEDMAALQPFIRDLLKTIHKSPDGVIIQCFTDDEKNWAINDDISGCNI